MKSIFVEEEEEEKTQQCALRCAQRIQDNPPTSSSTKVSAPVSGNLSLSIYFKSQQHFLCVLPSPCGWSSVALQLRPQRDARVCASERAQPSGAPVLVWRIQQEGQCARQLSFPLPLRTSEEYSTAQHNPPSVCKDGLYHTSKLTPVSV